MFVVQVVLILLQTNATAKDNLRRFNLKKTGELANEYGCENGYFVQEIACLCYQSEFLHNRTGQYLQVRSKGREAYKKEDAVSGSARLGSKIASIEYEHAINPFVHRFVASDIYRWQGRSGSLREVESQHCGLGITCKNIKR
jgi:hypothetical protein